MSITARDVRELAWILRMETSPRESTGALFERIRSRAAQLTLTVDECRTCSARANGEPTLEQRRHGASVPERWDEPAPFGCKECRTRSEHVDHVRRLMTESESA